MFTAPSAPPEAVSVSATSSDSILLTWAPPDSHHQNGIITGYVINVTTADTGEPFQVYSGTTSLIQGSLHPFTKYTFVVAAQTSVGTGPFSTTLTAQTHQSG